MSSVNTGVNGEVVTKSTDSTNYKSPFGFDLTGTDPRAVQRAYQVLARLASPEKIGANIYHGLSSTSGALSSQTSQSKCSGSGCCEMSTNMSSSEQTSRGYTTPF